MPIDYKKRAAPEPLVRSLLKSYPEIAAHIISSDKTYNNLIEEIKELENQGKALILYPEDCFGIKTITRDKEGLNKLYSLGYSDAEKIVEFLKNNA